MPAEWTKCIASVKASGKSEKNAYAICTAAFIKKHGRTPQSADKLEEVEGVLADIFLGLSVEDVELLDEYYEEELAELLDVSEDGETISLLWSAPTKRKDVPASHFFLPKEKKYPYRNPDGTVNCEGVLAAWKMAHGARSGKSAPASLIAKIRPYRDKCLKKKASVDDFDDVEKYTREFDAPSNTFTTISGTIALEDSKPYNYEKEKKVTIEVLREGKFQHPMYNLITFDSKIFSNFIRNFDDKVPQEHIAYDFRHQPDWGAAAWMKRLFQKGGKLFATVELTRRGYRALKDKEFLYFSTEYHDAYKDRETGKLYGPTILGGGLTNRPFIKGMAPVLMSEDGEEVFASMFEKHGDRKPKGDKSQLDDKTPTKGGSPMKKLLEALKALKDKIIAMTESDDGVQKKDLEEMNASMEALTTGISELKPEDLEGDDKKENEAKLEELSSRVVSLSERLGKIKVADPKADSKLEKLETRLGTFEKKLSDLPVDQTKLLEEQKAELEAKVKSLEEGNAALGDSVKKLQERGEARDKELYESKVATFTKELAEQGHYPSVCQEVTAILEAYEGQGTAVVTLSEDEGEGDKKKKVEKKLSLQNVISRILSAIPEDARIDTTERSKSPTKKEGDDKMLSVAEIEKKAEEAKISYGEMLVRLSEDPEYKDRIDI